MRSTAASRGAWSALGVMSAVVLAGWSGASVGLASVPAPEASSERQPMHRFAAERIVHAGGEAQQGEGILHTASCVQCDHGPGLGYLDIRLTDPVLAAVAEAEQRGPAAERTRAAVEALRRVVPGLTVDVDHLLGAAGFVRSTSGLMSGPLADGPVHLAVAAFVNAHRGLVQVSERELLSGRVTRDFVTEHNGVRHLTYQQQHDGLDVFGCEFRINLTRDRRIINLSSTMVPEPEGGFKPEGFTMTPQEAIVAAAADAGIVVGGVLPSVAEVQDGPSRRTTWNNTPEFRQEEPIVTERLYFPVTRRELRPAYSVLIPVSGLGHTYEYVVDARDGTVLHRVNRLVCSQEPLTFRVFTGNSPAPAVPAAPLTPNGQQFPFVERELITITPAMMGVASPAGWVTKGLTTPTGNNVNAGTDLDNNNVIDLPQPTGTLGANGELTFDYPFDPAQTPSVNRNAAIAQMFYLVNVFHDRLYALGFTEPARNFQLNNFGRGGTGNDRIQAEIQDGGGSNNANFSTGGNDGTTARVQMYLWTNPSPARDGAFDADIVYHELAHGLSIRLHGGLSGNQPQGMGEGWSDFFGVTLNAKPTDDPHANYTTGGWAVYQLGSQTFTNNYYFGIRRFPYSTSFARNPLTFADIDVNQFSVPANVPRSPIITSAANAVHQVGEVWCNTLLEMRAALWDLYGFEANELAMRLVVDGMKLSPGNPTFLQARDAIIQADIVTNAGRNLPAIWTAFAKRGMGFSATSPASNTTVGVSEAFDVPVIAQFLYPDGRPAQLSPGLPTLIRTEVVALGLTLTPGTQTLHYRVNGGAFTAVPMSQVGPSSYAASLPGQACGARVEWYLTTDTSQGPRRDPGVDGTSYLSEVYTGLVTIFADDFEVHRGWVVGPDTAPVGNWVRGAPIGTIAQPGAAYAGTNCYFTGQGTVGGSAGQADVDDGYTILTSPAFDATGYGSVEVRYARWYSNGLGAAPFADVFLVQVSNDNGATWTNAEVVGPGSSPDTQPGWRLAAWTLSSVGVTPTSAMRLRFIAEDAGSPSLVEAAVDEVQVIGRVCQPSGPAPCGPADIASTDATPGADGQIDNGDFGLFIASFFGAECPACGAASPPACTTADIASTDAAPGFDGCVDNGDFSLFIMSFFGTTCP
jgi:hypothetical protein